MPAQHSAGIVLYRPAALASTEATDLDNGIEIMLVHPGGPFWAKKDEHGWSIPKGEFDPEGEAGLDAAKREFEEELGHPVPATPSGTDPVPLPPFKAGRKTIHAWLVGADFDADNISSNTTEIEWPPRSGRQMEIPEVDRAAWFTLSEARTKLHKGQIPIVELIAVQLRGGRQS